MPVQTHRWKLMGPGVTSSFAMQCYRRAIWFMFIPSCVEYPVLTQRDIAAVLSQHASDEGCPKFSHEEFEAFWSVHLVRKVSLLITKFNEYRLKKWYTQFRIHVYTISLNNARNKTKHFYIAFFQIFFVVILQRPPLMYWLNSTDWRISATNCYQKTQALLSRQGKAAIASFHIHLPSVAQFNLTWKGFAFPLQQGHLLESLSLTNDVPE